MSKIAVILIRGLVGVRTDIKDTLFSLNLRKKHACVVVEDTPSVRGMLKKAQDYIAFGEITDSTYALLVEKRAKKDVNDELKPVFFLAPPVGGFERKGIKKPFTVGGALGDRKEKINDLLVKMI